MGPLILSLNVKVKDRVQLDELENPRKSGLNNIGVVLLPQARISEVGT